MLIVLRREAPERVFERIRELIKTSGYDFRVLEGDDHILFYVIGETITLTPEVFLTLEGVEGVFRMGEPYKLVSRKWKSSPTEIQVGSTHIGGLEFTIIAGPCAVESRNQLLETAHFLKEEGAHILRGGAYKPRTSPYSFQGLQTKALEYLAEAREQTGLPVVTEALSEEALESVTECADIIQVGARNMYNYELLKKVGRLSKPVLLKRGLSATMQEWLFSAEYIALEGNLDIILCERGVRTYETATRNTLDLSVVPYIHQVSHLPVIVDPSHATGKREFVPALARAAFVAGAEGIMIEVHPDPQKALSDGRQSLSFAQFRQLMRELRALSEALQDVGASVHVVRSPSLHSLTP